MERVIQLPLFKILCATVLGIVVSFYFPLNHYIISEFVVMVTLLVLLLVASFFYKVKKLIHHPLISLLVLLCVAFNAYVFSNNYNPKLKPDYFGHLIDSESYLLAEVKSLAIREKTIKAELNCLSVVKANKEQQACSGQLMAYFAKDSLIELPMKIGNQLLIKSRSIRIYEKPSNPLEFNFAQYMRLNGIFAQAYLRMEDWIKVDDNEHLILSPLFSLRQNLLSRFGYLPDNEKALASALLLGSKESLNDEIISDYSKTGAMHVLAVSGLHVGILALILNFLFGFLKPYKKGNYLRVIFTVSLIWFYALLAGLPPSVQRAALMFSILLIADVRSKISPSISNVFLAAIIMLSYSPFLLFHVGFQLSFIAVGGIILWQPIIYRWIPLYKIKIKGLRGLATIFWKVESVAIAAQLSTFPLALLYFHQFPNLFLLSNLVVIFGATLIMWLGFAVFAVSEIEFILVNWLKQLFEYVLFFCNQGVKTLAQIPHAQISYIHIDVLDTLLLFAISWPLLFAINYGKKTGVFIGLSAAILLSVKITYNQWEKPNHQLVVFNSAAGSVFTYSKNDETTLFGDSLLREKMVFNTRVFLSEKEKDIFTMPIKPLTSQPFIAIKNKLLQLYPERKELINPNAKVLIINKEEAKILENVPKEILVVMDASIKSWEVAYFLPKFAQAYSVSKEGAFIIEE